MDTAPNSANRTVPPASTEYNKFLSDGVVAACAANGLARATPLVAITQFETLTITLHNTIFHSCHRIDTWARSTHTAGAANTSMRQTAVRMLTLYTRSGSSKI
uniref:Uncharacterized protein n=1 Tax=Ulva partita TaxID=1605170 RepID=A0A1C9ZRQ0_9CHLO|nr:hypothetical protein [Ulva partita]